MRRRNRPTRHRARRGDVVILAYDKLTMPELEHIRTDSRALSKQLGIQFVITQGADVHVVRCPRTVEGR